MRIAFSCPVPVPGSGAVRPTPGCCLARSLMTLSVLWFSRAIGTILYPNQCDLQAARLRYGDIAWRGTVWPRAPAARLQCGLTAIIHAPSTRVADYSDLIACDLTLSSLVQVKLPAEQEDELKRPAYITSNNAGVRICENRYELSPLCSSVQRFPLSHLGMLRASRSIPAFTFHFRPPRSCPCSSFSPKDLSS